MRVRFLAFSYRAVLTSRKPSRQTHFLHWGRLYKADEVQVSWHGMKQKLHPQDNLLNRPPIVPSDPEIQFVLELLDVICTPLLERIEQLLKSVRSWDNVSRNDFCRLGSATYILQYL